jgi:hypothetical protein
MCDVDIGRENMVLTYIVDIDSLFITECAEILGYAEVESNLPGGR